MSSASALKANRVRAQFTTHGMSRSPTYKSWQMMKVRCYDVNHVSYVNYGGRGIQVDPLWKQSFSNFLNQMGERPEGKSLERIDVNGNYCAANCKWASRTEQALNRQTKGTGVTKVGNRYRAVIKRNYIIKHLGYFDTYQEAASARAKEENSGTA